MKAKEYMKRFDNFPELTKENSHKITIMAIKVVFEILWESKDLMESRKIILNKGMTSVFRELNDKFRAFNNLLTQKYKISILNKNAFYTLIKREMPPIWNEICKYLVIIKEEIPDEI